jgi:hypothetical protein
VVAAIAWPGEFQPDGIETSVDLIVAGGLGKRYGRKYGNLNARRGRAPEAAA